jgi:hypothetical protein
MAFFRVRNSTMQFTTTHHDSTTNSPQKNHVLPPTFSKTPCKNAQIPQTKKALLVRSLSVFSDKLMGESEVVLVAGGDEVAEDRVRL